MRSAGADIMLNARPRRRDKQRNAIGTHFGTAEAVTDAPMLRAGVRVCTGRSRISRETVALVSTRDRRPNGILSMLWARQSIAAAFGKLAHLAASAQGSFPSRA